MAHHHRRSGRAPSHCACEYAGIQDEVQDLTCLGWFVRLVWTVSEGSRLAEGLVERHEQSFDRRRFSSTWSLALKD